MLEFIENLLNGDAVQFLPLGEIASIYGGLSGKKKEDFENGNAYYITYKNIFSNIAVDLKLLEKVQISEGEKQHKVKKGDVLFTGSSESLEEVAISSVLTKDFEEDIYLNSFSFGLRFNDDVAILPDFAKFLFRSEHIRSQLKKTANGVTRYNVSKEKIKKIVIPIPPIRVQEEIVRILDMFSELTAELTAELSLRQKQYEYYREKLLTFTNDTAEFLPLGEVLIRTRGTKITATQMREIHKDNAPVKIFAGGKTVAYFNYDDLPAKDINTEPSIIVKSRGIIEFEYYDNPFSHKSEMWSYHSKNENINIKFVYYYLKMNEPYFQTLASKMQMPQIAIPDTDKYIIPIPPIEEQERIVSILDKFDSLVNSISEGLPAEINLRQKQYEYYRNALLSFD